MHPLYLYRTLQSDTDGDPLDFGNVRAATHADASRFVAEHLASLGFADAAFYLYPIADVTVGVLPSAGPRTRNPSHAKRSRTPNATHARRGT